MDICGAKTRAGTPCKQKAIYWNGRCKFHGGLATGPITEAGKEQSRVNGRKGGRPRKTGSAKVEAFSQQGACLVMAAAGETEVIEHQGNPKGPNAQVSARVTDSDTPTPTVVDGPAESPEKPKSWTLKDAKVLPRCERCAMFASNGGCLAIAKGVIQSIPTGDTCAVFSDFDKT